MGEIILNTETIKKINEMTLKSLTKYDQLMNYMSADLPIESLCLPKQIEKILITNGFLRVYDILNTDLIKVKGLGKSRINLLTSRLNEFLSVS